MKRTTLACFLAVLCMHARAATYYVATDGDDLNPGTSLAAPFRTIQRAALLSTAGDTVLVRGGVYRETVTPANSGASGQPITFQNYNGEAVVISGTDVVSGWSLDTGAVYRAIKPAFASTLNQSEQVFVDGRMMFQARWPNTHSLDVSQPVKAVTESCGALSTVNAGLRSQVQTITFTDNELPAGLDLTGAKIYCQPATTTWSWPGTGAVVSRAGQSLTVSGFNLGYKDGSNTWEQQSRYFLYGKRELLDANGEWHYDTTGQILYLRFPDGGAPASRLVEAKARDYGFVLENRSNIMLRGLRFFACTVTTDIYAGSGSQYGGLASDAITGAPGEYYRSPWSMFTGPGAGGDKMLALASSITLEGIVALYPSHYDNVGGHMLNQWSQCSGLILGGTDITVRDSVVRYSAGNGISLMGVRAKALNNLILDTNYMSTDCAAIHQGIQTRNQEHEIANNTIVRTGRSGINPVLYEAHRFLATGQRNLTRIHHNTIRQFGLQDNDCGGVRFLGDQRFLRVDHNVIAEASPYAYGGLYADFAKNYIFARNLMIDMRTPFCITGCFPDSTSGVSNAIIFNNTAVGIPALRNLTWSLFNNKAARPNTGSIIRNNIYDAPAYLQNVTPTQTLLWDAFMGSATDPRFASASTGDYTLQAASPAINLGQALGDVSLDNYSVPIASDPAFADTLSGAPDAGAFEYGQPAWSAGSTLAALVATPTISPAQRTSSGAETITLSCATPGASIYYTTDGGDPSSRGVLYTGPFSARSTAPIKAVATVSTMLDSAVATSAPVNTGGYSSISLRQGFNSYTGTQDTFLVGWSGGNGINGSATFMDIGSSAGTDDRPVSRSLLKFDVSSLPVIGTVSSVALDLSLDATTSIPSGASLTVDVYPISAANAAWVQGTATKLYLNSTATTPWSGLAGANGFPTIYTPTRLATFTLTASGAGSFTLPLSGDLTSLVQGWKNGVNGGLLLVMRNERFASASTFARIQSSEHPTLSLRPRLTIVSTVSTGVNTAPVAVADSAILAEDASALLNVLANDSDAESDTLTLVSVTAPAKGSASIENGQLRYTPNANANGSDSFSYTLSDGSLTATASVSVTITPVNDAPVAVADSATLSEDNSALLNVLTNDSDADGDTLSLVSVTAPAKGSASIENGQLRYTPNANANGSDSFSYTVSDGSITATASVSVTITPVNDAPAAVADSATLSEDTSALLNVLTNDSDADGDTLSLASVSVPAKGSASIENGQLRYTPNTNANGSDSFSYTVSDGSITATASVSVTITPVNDAPSAVADSATLSEDTSTLLNVLTNDSDLDGDTLFLASVSVPAKGSASIENGQLRYTPNTNANGSDSFSYTVSDGSITATASVSVTITPVNDAPSAVADSATVQQGQFIDINALANDSDLDGDSLTLVSVGTPSSGTATLVNGLVRYTASPVFTGTATLAYTVGDGALTSTGTITLTVTANPAIVTTVFQQGSNGYASTQDTYLQGFSGGAGINGAQNTLRIGAQGNTTTSLSRSLIRWDLPSLSAGIREVYSVTLDFTIDSAARATTPGGASIYAINPADLSWSQAQSTKLNRVQSTATSWASIADTNGFRRLQTGPALGGFTWSNNQTGLISVPLSGTDLTTLVRTWIQSGTNAGLILISNDETLPATNIRDDLWLRSSEYTTASSRPRLTVVYRPNSAPAAVTDSATLAQGSNTLLDVLANDSDTDGDSLTLVSVGTPAHGVAALENGQVRYTPAAGYYGSDSFTYTVSDDYTTSSATVTMIVTQTFLANDLTSQGLQGLTLGGGSGYSRILPDYSWLLSGSGSGYASTADSLHFEQETIGDSLFEIEARVRDLSPSGSAPRAGLLLRSGAAAADVFAALSIAANGQVYFATRSTAVAAGVETALSGVTLSLPDAWLRLARSGDTVTYFTSPDGIVWTQRGSATLTLPATVRAGLFAFGEAGATFDRYRSDSMDLPDAAVLGSVGSTTDASDGTQTLRGGGGNVFSGNAQRWRFRGQTLVGDGSVSARLTSLANTNSSAMAGVMMRESLADSAKYYAFMPTPSAGVYTQWKGNGNSVGYYVKTGLQTPVWVKVTRSGNNFASYYSTDGTMWTQWGSPVSITMNATIYVGLALNSGDSAQTGSATFDQIEITP